MFSFSQKALLFGVTTVALSGILFALDYSSQGNPCEEGVTVHLPESATSIAQNIPDAPIMPPDDETPENMPAITDQAVPENPPDASPAMLPPPAAMPSSAAPEPPPAMNQNRSMTSSLSSMSGDFRPGWRPEPPSAFPRNPFSGVSTMETPVAFKQEFDALAKNIVGFVEVGKNSVLIIQNRVIREGDTVKLMKEKEKGVSMGNEQQGKEEATAPVAIFSGVDKKKEIAKFMLGDIEVHIPIPSTRKKIEDVNGEVSRIESLATATFLGEKGYFVVASDLVPEGDAQKKVYIKTQFGSAVIAIVRRDAETNLALGRIESLNMIGLYNGILWGKAKADWEKSLADVLAFNVEKIEGIARPHLFKLNAAQSNPKWMAGCPMFLEKKVIGVLAKKKDKLTLIGKEELSRIFPDAFVMTQDDKQKIEGLTPSQLKTEEGSFFNPEKIVGLIYTITEE